MKRLLILLFLFATSVMHAQNHVKWTFTYNAKSSTVIASGEIEPGWHLYSQKTDENAGPIPTKMVIEPAKNYKIIGAAVEGTVPHEIFDKNFESTVYLFESHYAAEQQIKVKKSGTLKGEMQYMICDDTKCLPPISVPFTLEIN
ncbi:MAG: protein-disulfide reductase DsbD domain-containing protein [Flavobacteriales bacterium]